MLDRRRSEVLVILAGCIVALPAAADERILYKSALSGGRIAYGDAPAPGAKRTERITVEPHPVDPQGAEAAQRALGLTRAELLRDSSARLARIRQLDNEIVDAYEALKNAQVRREQAQEIMEGDRQGRRLLTPYFQRQASLQAETERLQLRLDRLVRERRSLQG